MRRISIIIIIALLLSGCSSEVALSSSNVAEPEPTDYIVQEVIKDSINESYEKYIVTGVLVNEEFNNECFKVIGDDDITMIGFAYPYRMYPSGLLRIGGFDGPCCSQYSVAVSESNSVNTVLNQVLTEFYLKDFEWLNDIINNLRRHNPLSFDEWEWTEHRELLYEQFMESLSKYYVVESYDLPLTVTKQDYSNVLFDSYVIKKNLSLYGYEDTFESVMIFWVGQIDNNYYIFYPKVETESVGVSYGGTIFPMDEEYLTEEGISELFSGVLTVARDSVNQKELIDEASVFVEVLSNKLFYVEEKERE